MIWAWDLVEDGLVTTDEGIVILVASALIAFEDFRELQMNETAILFEVVSKLDVAANDGPFNRVLAKGIIGTGVEQIKEILLHAYGFSELTRMVLVIKETPGPRPRIASCASVTGFGRA